MLRRALLAGAAAVALLSATAEAFPLFSGGAGTSGGGASVLTTLTLVNTSGSTQATNFVTKMFGHVFKKGDVPSGTYPQFQLTNGTVCPATIWALSTWTSDGSLRRCAAMIRVPSSIAGSSTLTINVLNGGSAPASSALSTANLSARDLKVVLTGITNLSGAWTSSLNTGISNATEIKVIANGQAGMVWRILQPLNNGSDHGQLVCYWYVAALQDASNGLWRIRYTPQIVQPYLDIDAPAKLKRGFSAVIKDGASTLVTMAPSAAFSFTTTNGVAQISATGHGLETGMGGQMSGSIPTGFSASTDYYVRVQDANNFFLFPTAGNAVDNISGITPTSSVTGTFTPHIELVHFAGCFGSQSNGEWQSIQGGGSAAADCTVRVQFNKTYWRSTRVLPPYDLTVTTNAAASQSYTPNGHGALDFFFETTGERTTIGVQPSWVAAHFLNQDAVSEQAVRVNALSLGNSNLNLRQHSTGTVPAVNNTAYTGMGSAVPTLRWSQTNVSGFTGPADDTIGIMDFSGNTSHWPSPAYYAALITGEPQYDDLQAQFANWAIYSRFSKSFTVSATTYYGAVFQDTSQARTDAWGSREVGLASALLPDAYWEASGNVKTYFTDCMKSGYDGMVAYNAAQSSFWTTNGIYHFRQDDCTGAPWQHSFMISVAALIYGATEYANALAFLNHLVKFPGAVATDIGIYHYTAFTMNMRTTDSGGGPLVTAMSQIHWSPGAGFSFTDTQSTNLTGILPSNGQLTITQGDKLLWFIASAPSGASNMVSYFARTVTDPGVSSNKTLKAATTNSDGTIITIGADNSGEFAGLRMQTIPPSGTSLDYPSNTGYCANARGAFRAAEAVGATMPGTIRADMDAIFVNTGATFTTEAKNAMTTAY